MEMHSSEMAVMSAEVELPSKDIAADIAFWTGADLGFRMDNIVRIFRFSLPQQFL
jgi:hypothetical protein